MNPQVAPNPQRIMQFTFGFIPSVAVAAAVDLGVFSALHQGHQQLDSLARACNCQPRGLEPLLHTLTSLGLLEFAQNQWTMAPDTALFLVPDSPAYLGGLLRHQVNSLPRWTSLAETVRQGRSVHPPIEGDEDDGAFFTGFVDALFNLNYPAAQVVAAQLGSVRSALDLGCGSAVWSLALAQLLPELRVRAVDRQSVLENITRPFLQRFGVAQRYELMAGNFREVDLGHSDAIFLGHILHSEGERASMQLLTRCRQALKPGGQLVIAEMVASSPRSAEVFPNLFDLNMLMWTEEGTVFTAEQLESMCREAGFSHCRWVQVPAPSPILVAH